MSNENLYRLLPAPLQTAALNSYALSVEWHRYGRRFQKACRAAEERESWDRDRLESYQNERLARVVSAAWKSPFYRDRFDAAGLAPEDTATVSDLEHLPLLTKSELRGEADRIMTSRPRRGWLHGHTSGTTGSPLGIWYDRQTCVETNAMDHRQKRWGGVQDGEWIGLFLGRLVTDPGRTSPPFWQPNYFRKHLWFSSFHMSGRNLPAYIQEIRRRRLRFLEGYPSTLFILARFLLENDDTLPMGGVFTSSETLHEIQKSAIEQAFRAPVFDFYGHAERAIFATECEAHEGKHLSEDYGFVEIVDEHGSPVPDGDPGYLVGTSLHNVAMPLVRYRTGDVSRFILGRCSCGRAFRRIASVTTKAEDIIVTPDGRMISPSVLTHPFKPHDSIRASQIVQRTPHSLLVRLVVGPSFDASAQRSLKEDLVERIGESVSIDFELVDEIPRTSSGKFRWVISEVDHSARFSWGDSVDSESAEEP